MKLLYIPILLFIVSCITSVIVIVQCSNSHCYVNEQHIITDSSVTALNSRQIEVIDSSGDYITKLQSENQRYKIQLDAIKNVANETKQENDRLKRQVEGLVRQLMNNEN